MDSLTNLARVPRDCGSILLEKFSSGPGRNTQKIVTFKWILISLAKFCTPRHHMQVFQHTGGRNTGAIKTVWASLGAPEPSTRGRGGTLEPKCVETHTDRPVKYGCLSTCTPGDADRRRGITKTSSTQRVPVGTPVHPVIKEGKILVQCKGSTTPGVQHDQETVDRLCHRGWRTGNSRRDDTCNHKT